MQSGGNVYFIGLMGAGKTTIGRAVAKRLGRRFVDADQEIERRTGVKISTIFEIEGEPGFRARETQVIGELVTLPELVLATGGGAILAEENRKALAETGFVIYLRASPRDLWARTRNDKSRPLLQNDDPLLTLQKLYQVRDPLYRSVAHCVVDTARQKVSHLVSQVLGSLPAECKQSA